MTVLECKFTEDSFSVLIKIKSLTKLTLGLRLPKAKSGKMQNVCQECNKEFRVRKPSHESPSPAVHGGQISGSSINWVRMGSLERAREVDLFSQFWECAGLPRKSSISIFLRSPQAAERPWLSVEGSQGCSNWLLSTLRGKWYTRANLWGGGGGVSFNGAQSLKTILI